VLTRRLKTGSTVIVLAVVTAFATAMMAPSASGVRSVRGFDGKTITVAGLGLGAQFAPAVVGTQARLKRFNDTNEIPGIKIKYTEFADDNSDPAKSTSEARRLVTQEGVFAILPDFSAVNPGPYLNQQHVPYLGFAFDDTYCSQKPTTKLYGFGYSGCSVPANPPVAIDSYAQQYKYMVDKTGKQHPTVALFSNDNQSGKSSSRTSATAAEGAGFKVVYAKGSVPMTTSDYAPYVQAWLTSDGGKQPDFISCNLATQCLPIWNALKAASFKGTYWTPLGLDLFAGPLEGTIASGFFNTDPNPGLTQMNKDLDAVREGKPLGIFTQQAYFAADMFIQALKKIPKDKITPEAVQKVLSTQTWQIKGLVGPVKYPASTVVSTPSCSSLTTSDGTTFKIVQPYSCTSKTFKLNKKFTGS
jgi:ABC-type branched-subunit amino acid transport system substrate-binding protein